MFRKLLIMVLVGISFTANKLYIGNDDYGRCIAGIESSYKLYGYFSRTSSRGSGKSSPKRMPSTLLRRKAAFFNCSI